MKKHLYYLTIYYPKKTINLFCDNFMVNRSYKHLRSKLGRPTLLVFDGNKILNFYLDKAIGFEFEFVY